MRVPDLSPDLVFDGDYVVEAMSCATDGGPDEIWSSLFASTGAEMLHADFTGVQIASDDGGTAGTSGNAAPVTIQWRWLQTGESGTIAIPNPATAITSISNAARTTILIAAQIPAAVAEGHKPVPMNTAGCDGFGSVDLHKYDCTNAGECCDVHDQCYYDNNCDANSWTTNEGTACSNCNRAVVACFLGVGLTSPGPSGFGLGAPSACCSLGNCGATTCKMVNNVPITGAACGAPNAHSGGDPHLVHGP